MTSRSKSDQVDPSVHFVLGDKGYVSRLQKGAEDTLCNLLFSTEADGISVHHWEYQMPFFGLPFPGWNTQGSLGRFFNEFYFFLNGISKRRGVSAA